MGHPAKVSRRTGEYTFEDFCNLVREDQKADLIDGVIYMASPENMDAAKLFWWLGRLLSDYLEAKDLGELYGSRTAFRLDEKSSPEPDLAFVRKDRLGGEQRGYFDGPPDLAIEIVSPDSVERDYELKRQKYQESGVREYWIIDEHEEKVTLLRLGGDGEYREAKPRKGEYQSKAVPGFWLRPEWLWQQPRPKKADVLAEILARGN